MMDLYFHGVTYMRISSIISIFSCSIAIYIMYKNNYLKTTYNNLILYVTISDLLGAFFLLIGSNSQSGSVLCYVQGMGSNYFQLTSFFWTSIISVEVWSIVKNSSYKFDSTLEKSKRVHLLCWGIPFIVTMLPIVSESTTYTNDDFTVGWCGFYSDSNKKSAIVFWFFFGFYIWFILCALVMVTCIILSIYRLRVVYKGLNASLNMLSIRLSLFPIIILFCWTLPMIGDLNSLISVDYDDKDNELIVYLSYILPSLQGLLSVIAFFIMNRDFKEWNKKGDIYYIFPLCTIFINNFYYYYCSNIN